MDQSATSTLTNSRRLSRIPLPRSSLSNSSNDASLMSKKSARPASAVVLSSEVTQPTSTASSVPILSKSDHGNGGQELRPKKNVSRLRADSRVQDTILETSPGQENSTTPHNGQNARSNISATAIPIAASPSKIARKPRPSLSDRTLETLSQIPPSPSPRRRQSGFFATDSPMRASSGAITATHHSRPNSRAGQALSAIPGYKRPPSPNKKFPLTASKVQMTSIPSKRAVSSYNPHKQEFLNGETTDTLASNSSPRNILPGSTPMMSTPSHLARKTLNGTKTMVARSPGTRSPVKGLFSNRSGNDAPSALSTRPLFSGKKIVQSRESDPNKTKLQKASIPKASQPKHMCDDDGESQGLGKVSASSQSLRETIAKVKAAHRQSTITSTDANVPRAVVNDNLTSISMDVDPFLFDLTESGGVNILRKRINSAKTDGRLNIASLCLKEIPEEVVNMYDYDPNNEDAAWYENVDLTRFIAADNEISELKEDAFPDVANAELSSGGIFHGLEVMDFRGNQLRTLPPGLSALRKLTTLNLSRNQIENEALEVISYIPTLKELRLGDNSLTGELPDILGELKALEILDLHGNSIEDIPQTIESMSKLKVLNVAGNKLTVIPMAAMGGMPLTEIMASHNRLNGHLFPSSISQVTSLQILDVSHNALVSIGDGQINMPLLHTFDVSSNRLTALPDLTVMHKLSTLNASENQIRTIPEGFTSLQALKSADFSGNSLLTLDDGIGSMESLTILNISNNPLRERRLLRMNIEDLKLELRVRLSSHGSVEGSLSDPTSPTGSKIHSLAWPVKEGVLDRSHTKLSTVSRSDLEAVVANDEVRSLVLHHNPLQTITPVYEVLGYTLASLDLSYNKYGQNSAYFSEPVDLPRLQTLNLTSNALTTLDPLVTYLSAPSLTTLIIPFNRLTALPQLCTAFPALTKLLAANNAIVSLDVDAIRGLQVLDVSSNEIAHLPPRLALLQGQLRTLMVNGNRFRVPGWGVVEKGTEEILNWCRMRIPAGEEGAVVEDDVD